MSYKALYRKYRPQSFEEVAGQEAIVKTLKNAFERNKIAHAYLFSGPRGTGKTSMAKLFAKALNCEEGIGHQCNHCSNCQAIIDGTHPDVIEIDAASNNGVEEVRSIIEKVKYLPIKGKYKVYIIDEVHMMTPGAFNALLKTLEEPPAHIIFILATTEPHKILPTILSRCQRYEFSKVEDKDILNRMKEILDQEKVTYEEEALKTIVQLADGGVRDALSMLDQVLAYSNDKVVLNDVLTIFAIASKQEKMALLESLGKHDIKETLNKMNNFVDLGIDISHLVSNMLEILRDLLIFVQGGQQEDLITLTAAEAESLYRFIDKKMALEMIDVLLQAQKDFKYVSNIRSLFEIVLLKLCSIDSENSNIRPQQYINKQEEKNIQPAPIVKDEPAVVNTPVEKVTSIPESTPIEEPKQEETKSFEQSNKQPDDGIPDWMLEDDAPAEEIKEEPSGEFYSFSDDALIEILVASKREERLRVANEWSKLNALAAHPSYAKSAILLKDGSMVAVCNEVIILSYNIDKKVRTVNDKVNQKELSSIMEKIIGRKIFVYAITRDEQVALTKKFQQLRQISKLPKLSDIKIELPN